MLAENPGKIRFDLMTPDPNQIGLVASAHEAWSVRVGNSAQAEHNSKNAAKRWTTIEDIMAMEALNSSEKMANKWPLMSQEELLSVLPFGGQNISAKDPNLTLPYVKKDHDLIGKFFLVKFLKM